MRVSKLIRFLLFLAILAFTLTMNITAQDLGEAEKIPRRVVFELSNSPPAGEYQDLLSSGLRILYESVSAETPIIRSYDIDAAHNSCSLNFEEEGRNVRVIASLYEFPVTAEDEEELPEEETEPMLNVEEEFLYTGDYEEYRNFLVGVASAMAGHLDLVSPEVRVITKVEEGEEKKVVAEVRFEEELARPFEFTLYPGGLTKEINVNMNSENYLYFSLWPLQLDAVWFPGRGDFGLNFSLFFNTLDMDMDLENEWIIMPGLGIQYRIGGRFYGSFGLSFFGGVYLSGEEAYFYNLLGLFPALGINITPTFGITLRVGGFLLPASLFAGGGEDFALEMGIQRNLLSLQLATIGFLLRPDW
jgi:hypothetical protein